MASRGKIVKLLLVMVWVIFCAAGQISAGETPALRDAGGGAVEWYVDDDGPGDPGPGDPTVSDPNEDGSQNHPFDKIQEAINAARQGDTIWVLLGAYYGNINFKGKNVILTSTDPTDPAVVEGTIIQGNGKKAPVIFSGTEDDRCELTGFAITGGSFGIGPGGGIRGNGTTATISRCIVSGNITSESGGGIHSCDGLISQCRVIGNISVLTGGGLYKCNGLIKHCIISSNTGHNGGGLAKCHGTIINCLISDNHANNYGGGINNCDGDIINCTIADNTAVERGVLSNCDGVFQNCIVWGNNPAFKYKSTAIFRYNCLEWTGSGLSNIKADPDFASANDYHIISGSPCIDAGTNWGIPAEVVTDLDGAARFFDDPATSDTGYGAPPVVDMGAYEYLGTDPYLVLSTDRFEFTKYEGGANPGSRKLFIHNGGGGEANWEIDYDCDWLTISPTTGSSEGESVEVILTVDFAGLLPGDYSCEVIISDPGSINSPQVVDVSLHVIGPNLEISKTQFRFTAYEDDPNPQDQKLIIRNTGAGTLNWKIFHSCNWLTVEPSGGSLTRGDPWESTNLRVDITDLVGGDYDCEITVSDPCAANSPQVVDVSLQVIGPILEISKSQFEFTVYEDGPNPQDQEFIISNTGGGTINWKISHSCSWLTVEPSGGSLTRGDPSESIALGVNIADLVGGDYECEITVFDPCMIDSSQIIDVGLHVIGPIIELSESELEFSAFDGRANPQTQVLTIDNIGGGTLNWQVTSNRNWLKAEPASGSLAPSDQEDVVFVNVEINSIRFGDYYGQLTVSDNNAENNPQTIQVHLHLSRKIYVPQDYPNIQAAIDTSADGDTILVADGTYTGEGNRDIDFKGKAITVRSENGPESCIIDCEGYRYEPHRGFNFHNNEGRDSVVDGFKIINGYVYTDGKVNSFGSGIICNESSPTIRNCWIVVTAGWGINILGSPRISRCRITGSNPAIMIYKYSSDDELPIIENNILNCTCGIYLFPDPRNLIIRNNVMVGTDLDKGYGIQYREHSALATITGNIITHFRNGIDFTYKSLESQRKALITYNNVWGNTNNFYMHEGKKTWQMAGTQGNISLDPMFVDTVNRDYHLQRGSPCIDAGKDTGVYEDMDGSIRPWDYPGVDNNGEEGEFDMGAYEFVNGRPVAEAGEDRRVWAELNGLAEVMLDGSDTYDPDGDELTYHWSWTVGGEAFSSSGEDGKVDLLDYAELVKQWEDEGDLSKLAGLSATWLSLVGMPNYDGQFDMAPGGPYLTVELPVGVHEITLVVNDGIEDSEPEYVFIIVLQAGDIDGDDDVDMDDLAIVLAGRNMPAEGPDDPRDLDGDGMITVLDARLLVTLFTG